MKRSILPLCLLGSVLMLPALAQTDTPAATAEAAATAPATAPASVTSPIQGKFLARSFPGRQGAQLGIVVYKADSNTKGVRLVEIPAPLGGMKQFDRANTIADRLQNSDGSVLKRLQPGIAPNGDNVLIDPQTGKWIITADPDSAAYDGFAKAALKQYTGFLQSKIVGTLSGLLGLRDAPFDYQLTGGKKHERAITYRQQADESMEASDARDSVRAEKLYLEAINLDPQYAAPYLQLCSLYLDENKPEEAKKIQQKATDARLDLVAEAAEIKSPELIAMLAKL